MSKAEMELHSRLYHEKLGRAAAAERSGMYRAALDATVDAWQYIDGMMQYARKYEGREFSSVPAIDLALKYAPLLLDMRRLDELDRLLREFKRIDRLATDDIALQVKEARARVRENHRLWAFLERNPGTPQDELETKLGGSQAYWQWIAEAWSLMGLLNRTSAGGGYTLSLATRMTDVARAKCPACGRLAESLKSAFLEHVVCPACRSRVLFVLMAARPHVA